MTTKPLQVPPLPRRLPLWVASAALLLPAALAVWAVVSMPPIFEPEGEFSNSYKPALFQSPQQVIQDDPVSEPSLPSGWIASAGGGECKGGGLTIIVPSGFTNEAGAVFDCNRVIDFSSIGRPPAMVNGSDFWISVFNPNNQNSPQTRLNGSLQIRITMDAAQFDISKANQLAVMMYVPSASQWRELSSWWDPGTFQMVAQTQQLTPFQGSSSGSLNNRTVFLVLLRGTPAPQPVTTGPVAAGNANLRIGPGTNFAIVGGVRSGQALQIVGRNANGDWYRLSGGNWIYGPLVRNAPANLPVESTTAATAVATTTPTNTQPAQTSGPTVNANANLRAGPGTTYDRIGSARAGQALTLVARNEAGTWYRLESGAWISASLVDGAPNLPVASD